MTLHTLKTLCIGDFVKLNSGGPDMQIIGFLGSAVNVSFPDPNHEFGVLYTFFPAVSVRKI